MIDHDKEEVLEKLEEILEEVKRVADNYDIKLFASLKYDEMATIKTNASFLSIISLFVCFINAHLEENFDKDEIEPAIDYLVMLIEDKLNEKIKTK
jgi:hypothetical protein